MSDKRPPRSTRRELQESFQLERFTVGSAFAHHKEFYRLSSPWTELNVLLFASTFHEPPPPRRTPPRAKLFSALYLAPCSAPPTRRSRSNSRRLVKVGRPEMWKSVMGDSSFGLSPRKAKGLKKKGVEIPITQLMTIRYMDKCNRWLTLATVLHARIISLRVGGTVRETLFLFRGIRCLWR